MFNGLKNQYDFVNQEMSMSMLIINGRTRSAQARDFGKGEVRVYDMRWHIQAGRAWLAP